jgi:RNA polymerase sigma-54 factor
MEIKQQLRLTQQLVMTPQLQQAIRLLQLSRLELVEEVRKELDGNPVLSDDESGVGRSAEGAGQAGRESPIVNERPVHDRQELSGDARETERATREVDWEKFLENRTLQQPAQGPRGGFEELPPIEQSLTRPVSLRDHLLWQLQMSDFTEEERGFAELVIGNLDDRGYLDLGGVERTDGSRTPDLTVSDLAEEAGLHPDDAEDVLAMIHDFDPLGVAARDLRECLLIQAKTFGYDEVEIEIIDHHLHNLEKHNYQAIARDMKIPVEEVYEAAREIQKLESRPTSPRTTSAPSASPPTCS